MSAALRRAVFLDRDGVLNRAVVRDGRPYPPAGVDQVEIPAEVPTALRAAHEAGFLLVGITNQPDVARGTTSRETVASINRRLLEALPLVDILVCHHDNPDRCDCRKPAPGLLFQAADTYGIDLPASFMVGDRWRDVEAGRRAGCTTVWIDYGYSEDWPVAPPDRTVKSLSRAIAWILRTPGEKDLNEVTG